MKLLVDGFTTKIARAVRSFVCVYPSALDLSTQHLRFLTDRLAAHRAACGTRWRRLSAGRQALLVLAHLRLGHTYAQLATGFEVGLACWADQGYQGAGGTVRVPFRSRWDHLSTGQRAVNAAHARIRALGEQAGHGATLKTWHLVRKLRCSTLESPGSSKSPSPST